MVDSFWKKGHSLVKHLLLVFILLYLIPPSFVVAQQSNLLEEKMLKIDRLIYEKNDYDSALQICKEVTAIDPIDKYYVQKVASIANLIEYYSDYDEKPLELYFEARKILDMWCKGENHTKESWVAQGNLYRELLNKYPACKLGGFVQYLLATHYKNQIGNSLSYLDKKIARQKAIEAYSEAVNKYPQAVFPICGYPQYFKLGLRIAPVAQINVAWLYMYESSDLKPDIEEALRTYQVLIDEYPDAIDQNGRKLSLSAYVSLLNIYSGLGGHVEFVDTAQAKRICNILINNFPNQQYEIEGWYFGEIHPEAYTRLAKLELDREKAIELYEKLITHFPESWRGKSGSGATGLYAVESLDEILKLLGNAQLAIRECHKILSSKLDKAICGYAQFRIATIYEIELKDYDQALFEYQKVIDDYGDVHLDGESWTLGEGVEDAISRLQDKMNKGQ